MRGENVRPGRSALCGLGDLREREALHVPAHHFAGFFPDCQQHALAFVVTCAILMRFAEVAERDGAIDRGENLGKSNLVGWAGQHVTAAHTTLGTHEAGAFQSKQNLLEVRLRKSGAARDITDRCWSRLIDVESQRQQGPTGIVTFGGNAHIRIVGAKWPRPWIVVRRR